MRERICRMICSTSTLSDRTVKSVIELPRTAKSARKQLETGHADQQSTAGEADRMGCPGHPADVPDKGYRKMQSARCEVSTATAAAEPRGVRGRHRRPCRLVGKWSARHPQRGA